MVELVFIHLPKTGGSSILETLNHVYGEDNVRHFERDECLQLNEKSTRISDVITDSTKVIHGHIRFKEIEDLVKRDSPKLVTFMRNPVDRVISNFNWFKHTLSVNNQHPAKGREDEPLEVYIRQKETRNKMTRFLEGAKLSQFFFIGFLESFQADVKTLGSLLYWPDSPAFHEKEMKFNSKKKDQNLDERLVKRIQDLNKKDMRLYLKAKKSQHS